MFSLTIADQDPRPYTRKHDAQRVARKALERDPQLHIIITNAEGKTVFETNVPAAPAEDLPVVADQDGTEAEILDEVEDAGDGTETEVISVDPAPAEDDEPAIDLAGEVVDVTTPVPADQVPPAPARKRGRRFEITDSNLMVAKPFTLTDWEHDGDFLKVTTAPLSTDPRMLKVTVEGEDIDGAILRGPGGYWRSVQFTEGMNPEVSGKCNNREIAVRDLLNRTGFRV